jgi:catechol 2,3-dioxygenase-like lactoylglutathione lyase family enzyme
MTTISEGLMRTVLAILATAALTSAGVLAQAPAQAPVTGPTVGIMHALHATTSIEKTAAFYRDVFGFDGNPRLFPNPAVPLLTNSPGVTLHNVMYRVPGAGFNFELTEFSGVDRHAGEARITDPGAAGLVFIVRDLAPVVEAVKKTAAPILTLAGAPVTVRLRGDQLHRMLTVRDPDGYILQVIEDNQPPGDAPAGNVWKAIIAITAGDMDTTLKFWNGMLGFDLKDTTQFSNDKPMLDALGVAKGEYRIVRGLVPNSQAAIEFLAFKGAPAGKPLDLRVPDPGAAGMAIRITGLDALVPRLKAAGVRVISKDGQIVDFGAASRNIFVKDPNGINIELIEAKPRPAPAADGR